MKYKENLSTKLFLLQYDKNALTAFLHSTDELSKELKNSIQILVAQVVFHL